MAERWAPLITTPGGVKHEIAFEGDKVLTRTTQDVGAILDRNKAMANHNDGYTKDKTFRRAAFIPQVVIEAWRNENPPIDIYSTDPAVRAEIKRRLNSNEYLYLRTAPGRI